MFLLHVLYWFSVVYTLFYCAVLAVSALAIMADLGPVKLAPFGLILFLLSIAYIVASLLHPF